MRLIALILLFSVRPEPFGQATRNYEESTLNVTIHLCTPNGAPIDLGDLEVRGGSGGRAFAGSIYDGANLRLRPGEYVVIFSAPNFKSSNIRIKIDQEHQFIVTGGEFATLDSPEVVTKISLKVLPIKSCSDGGYLWAKLIGVFQPVSKEVLISKTGRAVFDNLQHGNYIIAVIDGELVRSVGSLSTRGPVTDIELSLRDCPAADGHK